MPHPLVQYLASRLIGWKIDLLELLLAVTMAGRTTLFIGRHGTGKTVCARLLCAIFRLSTRFFNAAHDDLLMIAGLPSVTAMAEGRLEWLGHQRTVWGTPEAPVEACFADELNRSEELSCWLGVLDRNLFGQPLPLKAIFAAANPDTEDYETRRWDSAVVDRCHILVPIAQPADLSVETLAEVAQLNLRGGAAPDINTEEIPDGRPLLTQFQETRELLLADRELCRAVSQWGARLVHAVLTADRAAESGNAEQPAVYVSFRALGMLSNTTIDFLAYLLTAHGPMFLTRLIAAAELVSEYAVGTKCGIPAAILSGAQTDARGILRTLVEQRLREHDRLRPIAVGSLCSRIQALESIGAERPSCFDGSRFTMLVGQLVTDACAALERGASSDEIPAGRLWRHLGERFPEQRHALEVAILRRRLTAVTADLAPHDSQWAPWTF